MSHDSPMRASMRAARPPREDLDACHAILRAGSKSFRAAAQLLPARLRDPVAAYYAFCRVSDDAIDQSDAPAPALDALRRRLDAIAADRPGPHPADRGLAWVMRAHGLSRAPIDALLEGYAWDAERRRFASLAEVRAYAARVAGSVGVGMTALMGPREPSVLARAADLGVAMQLTNIARDVGEDARRGRVYLPLEWLERESLDPDAWIARPRFSPGLGVVVCRLLDHAAHLYRRAERGIAHLPADCRTAIGAAGWIYEDIGRVVRARGYDSVSSRARTSAARKGVLVALALSARWPTPTDPEPPPLPETRFLWEAR